MSKEDAEKVRSVADAIVRTFGHKRKTCECYGCWALRHPDNQKWVRKAIKRAKRR